MKTSATIFTLTFLSGKTFIHLVKQSVLTNKYDIISVSTKEEIIKDQVHLFKLFQKMHWGYKFEEKISLYLINYFSQYKSYKFLYQCSTSCLQESNKTVSEFYPKFYWYRNAYYRLPSKSTKSFSEKLSFEK